MTNRKHLFEPLEQNPGLACKVCGFGIRDHFTNQPLEREAYARELRLFVQRLIKMAKEQIVVGRNYGWTQRSMAQDLDMLIHEQVSQARAEWVREVRREIEAKRNHNFEEGELEAIDVMNSTIDDILSLPILKGEE